MSERKIGINIYKILEFLKTIDDAPYAMYDLLKEKGFVVEKKRVNINSADKVLTSGLIDIFEKAINYSFMDFQYLIAEELGMPKYDPDNTSVYDYVDLIFLTYYNGEITEEELIEGITINATDKNFKLNEKFIKAIGGWQYLNLD
ncbi:hypothetical protein [Niallia taxi]|uniref:hypothetical protein n=1 Tax=Niallia taxi TaxID=2499688 RepID=UPI002E20C8BF|nr:hypothetical protein [Niallia taxi]